MRFCCTTAITAVATAKAQSPCNPAEICSGPPPIAAQQRLTAPAFAVYARGGVERSPRR